MRRGHTRVRLTVPVAGTNLSFSNAPLTPYALGVVSLH